MPTWLLVHGLPGSPLSWSPVERIVSGAATLEPWTLLDTGDREAPEATVDDLVADLATHLASQPSPVVLVGHSFGAWVAAHAAARVPGAVARCVLAAGCIATPDAAAAEFEGIAGALEGGQLTPAVLGGIAASRWLSAGGPDTSHRAILDALFATETPARLARAMRRVAAATEPVPRLSMPVKVLCGTEDGAMPADWSRALAVHLGCPIEEWAESAHFLHWGDPARFVRAVSAE